MCRINRKRRLDMGAIRGKQPRGLPWSRIARPAILFCSIFLCSIRAVEAVEYVTLKRDGRPVHLSGDLLVEAEDGGLLLRDAEGVLWAVQPDELTARRSDDKPLELLDREAQAERLRDSFPDGFRVHNTVHYLICYNTTEAYAHWCGALFERLYAAFHTYWGRHGMELNAPKQPLVALVFQDGKSYTGYAQEELGEAASAIIGYYSLRSNRVTMYDLTRADRLTSNRRVTKAAHVNNILMRPDAERTVATIIHEATHQLAFNCGLQQRYADIPLWVSEGVAVYFETPDLRSNRGWRGIGAVNQARLAQFRKYSRTRPADSLRTLLADDSRFRQSRQAINAYAEAWALNYFLLKRYSKKYSAYLNVLARKTPLLYDTPDERIRLFESKLDMPLAQLDAEFLRYIARLR